MDLSLLLTYSTVLCDGVLLFLYELCTFEGIWSLLPSQDAQGSRKKKTSNNWSIEFVS